MIGNITDKMIGIWHPDLKKKTIHLVAEITIQNAVCSCVCIVGRGDAEESGVSSGYTENWSILYLSLLDSKKNRE